MKTIDLIVPCYNEAESLPLFYEEIRRVAEGMPAYRLRLVLVNDGSTDATLSVMRSLAATDNSVSYYSFSRNFGKEAAMLCGFRHSDSDLVAVIDADLQHPPALLPLMAAGIEEGYDCCAACRSTRAGENRLRAFISGLFYRFSNSLTEVKLPQNAVDYRMMTRQMADAVLSLSESERFSKGIFSWVGFETKWIPYENVERRAGTSKWNFRSLTRYALNGITAFSVKPLTAVRNMGIFLCAASMIYILATLIKTLITGIDVPGYTSTLCIVLFLGGIIELSLGIVGEYIAHIYKEAKDRPVYILKEEHPFGTADETLPEGASE